MMMSRKNLTSTDKQSVRPGEKHFVATAILITNKSPRRALLAFHKKLGVWMPPGGHREFNENLLECLVREVKEETGLDISHYVPKPMSIIRGVNQISLPDYFFEETISEHNQTPQHYHLDFLYVVEVPNIEPILNRAEHIQVKWFSKSELEHISLLEDVRLILDKLL